MDVAYGINGVYNDPIACIITVVTYVKDFSGSLKDSGQPPLSQPLIGSTRNICDFLLT
jgi:hypothetical protein